MIDNSSDGISKKYFLNIDPHDPNRALCQMEQSVAVGNFAVIGTHTIRKGADVKDLEKALEKYYEWYPVVGKTIVPKDGIFHFTEGEIRSTTFAEDIKNNKVIKSKDDYYDVLSETYHEYYNGKRYAFGPRLYKVDISSDTPDKTDNIINSEVGYVMDVPTDHAVFDGKSHRTLRNFINNFINDKSYIPRLSGPQKVPNACYALIPKDAKYKPMEDPVFGPTHHIGYEKNIKIDKFKRGINLDVRRLNKSDLVHPKGYGLTSTMSGVLAFLHTSLILDYYPEEKTVGHIFSVPYAVNQSKFLKLMDGDPNDMVGNDVTAFNTYQKTQRDHPMSLMDSINVAEMDHRKNSQNIDQSIINSRYKPYTPIDLKYGPESIFATVSNFGNLNLKKGVIDTTTAYGIYPFNIGTMMISCCGQPDGSIMFALCSHKTSFPRDFLKLYSNVFLRLLKISTERDMTREELISLPEYKKMVEILKYY